MVVFMLFLILCVLGFIAWQLWAVEERQIDLDDEHRELMVRLEGQRARDQMADVTRSAMEAMAEHVRRRTG